MTLAYRPEDGVASIESGSYSSRVNVFAAEDFPRLPSIDVPLQEVDAASLLETVQRVSRAASRDESRPVLTGILVRFEGSQLTMAATDSYRMAVKETELESSGPELEAIIPARALDELGRVAAGAESVQLGVHENHVIFGAGSAWLTTRRIDGQFPNVAQLRPETFDVELELPRGELLEAVRRAGGDRPAEHAAPAPLRRGRADDLRAEPGRRRDAGVAPRSRTPASRSRSASTRSSCAKGSSRCTADTVQLKLINPLRPGLLSAEGDAFWYLIMPIRLAG